MARSRGVMIRFLDVLERVGNKLPDPVTLFAIFALLVVIGSWLAAAANVSAIHPGTGDTVTSVNLMSAAGLRRMLTEAVANFAAFPPLGLVIVVIIGVAVTEQSGLISVALRRLVGAVPRSLLTATLVFAGINSSLAVDAGFVVLVPLGALIFASAGRHPLAGLAAAFAGVAGGFSANLFITSLDPLLSGLTTTAAQLIDPDYVVDPSSNYFFMVASVFLLTALGTFVSDRFVEPRLGTWDPQRATATPALEMGEVTAREQRALRAAGIAFLLMLALIALLVLPEGAPLRDPAAAGQPMLVQVRPFFTSIVTLLMLLFLVIGVVYGVVAGTIRSDRDVARMASDGVAMLGSYIVLAFFAAQFVAYFNWSNMGIILAIKGADGLEAAGIEGVPLLLSFVVVAAFLNLFIGSASALWAVIAPVFVPMLMLVGHSPEVIQAAYRIGDSSTNIISPLMQYFPIIFAFAQRWDRESGIGTLISMMLPYAIVFLIGWMLLLAVWLSFGLPVGPGAPLNYMP